MSYVPTGIWQVQKLIQRTVETTYGAKKTSSPSFTNVGSRVYLKENTKAAVERYRKEGSRDIYKMLKYGELYSISLRFGIFDTAMLRYGMELPNGAGTIEESLQFLYSKLLNNSGALLEKFKFYLGARCDQTEIVVNGGAYEVTQNYIVSDILAWNAAHGLTTPTYASVPTGDPWNVLTGGSSQLSLGGTAYDTDNAKITVKNRLEAIRPNGETKIKMLWPTNRDIDFEFEGWLKDDTEQDWVRNLTNLASAYYRLNSSGPKDITFTNLKFDDHEVSEGAVDNKHTKFKIKGSAEQVTVTA